MSTATPDRVLDALATDRPMLDAAEVVALLLVALDVWLTNLVVVHGPAVEVGLGASRMLDVAGMIGVSVVLAAGVLWCLQIARFLGDRLGSTWATFAAGYVVGILAYNVITNFALALRAGAL